MMRILLFSIVLLMLVSTSCGRRATKKMAEENETQIQEYLNTNNIDAIATGSGLYYIVDSVTSGDRPAEGSFVNVNYKGYYLDGEVFDQSPATGIAFDLDNVIHGWREGIPLFREGEYGRLFVPAHLGYGRKDYNGIPGGSVLIFDIELIEI